MQKINLKNIPKGTLISLGRLYIPFIIIFLNRWYFMLITCSQSVKKWVILCIYSRSVIQIMILGSSATRRKLLKVLPALQFVIVSTVQMACAAIALNPFISTFPIQRFKFDEKPIQFAVRDRCVLSLVFFHNIVYIIVFEHGTTMSIFRTWVAPTEIISFCQRGRFCIFNEPLSLNTSPVTKIFDWVCKKS